MYAHRVSQVENAHWSELFSFFWNALWIANIFWTLTLMVRWVLLTLVIPWQTCVLAMLSIKHANMFTMTPMFILIFGRSIWKPHNIPYKKQLYGQKSLRKM